MIKDMPPWLVTLARLVADALRVAMLALLAGSSAAAALASGLAAVLPPDALKLFGSLCRALLLLPLPASF